MMKVKLILSLDQLEKAYKEYKKAFRFSGLFFGIHQEIMEDKDFEKYLNQYNTIFLNMQEFLSRSHNVEELIDRVKKLVIRDLKME